MTLTLIYFHLAADGYGLSGAHTAAALAAWGTEVRSADLRTGQEVQAGGPGVVFCVPPMWKRVHAAPLLGFTMFEATQLPVGWARLINERAAVCLVPCQANERTFLGAGVRVPIRVVPLGIDPQDWPYCERQHEGPYRFLWAGTPDKRKGWDLVYRAFRAAFGAREDAQLIMHFREMPYGIRGCRDENVELWEGELTLPTMQRLVQDADCFVYPSRGEGWGLPPREAAATGLPVIATDWGGLAENIFQWALPLRVKNLVPAEYGCWDRGEIGNWAEPDFDHLVELMRWCYEQRESAAEIGRHAAEWQAERGTWQNTALGVMAALQEAGGC